MVLSIIIPAYNAADSLDDCIMSLYSEPTNELHYEVIIVNDGSSDSTLQKIQKWAILHHNISILDKDMNQGVSAARNDAIDIARGDYITFLDADDWFDTKGLNQMIQELINHPEVDGLILNIENAETGEYKYAWQSLFNEGENYTFEQFFQKNWYGRGSACAIAYKRSSLNRFGFRFALDITNGEDTIFATQFLTSDSCFRFLDAKLYYVRKNAKSASRNYSQKRFKGSMMAVDYCYCFTNNNDLSPKQKTVFNWLLYQLLSNALNTACYLDLSYTRINYDYNIQKYLPIPIKGIERQRKKIRILNKYPKLFYWLVKIKNVIFANKLELLRT